MTKEERKKLSREEKRLIRKKSVYVRRNFNLKRYGFADYQEYLGSSLWLEVRGLVMKKFNYKCALCSSAANVVHHIQYTQSNLIGLNLYYLIPLCFFCHEKIHKICDALGVSNARGTRRAFRDDGKLWKYRHIISEWRS